MVHEDDVMLDGIFDRIAYIGFGLVFTSSVFYQLMHVLNPQTL